MLESASKKMCYFDEKIDSQLYQRTTIVLKLGKFKPAYEGQMRLYLRYLNKNDRKPWEEEPIGLILCSEGNTEHIQYFMLDEDSDIRVAQYYTELPSKEVLSDAYTYYSNMPHCTTLTTELASAMASSSYLLSPIRMQRREMSVEISKCR